MNYELALELKKAGFPQKSPLAVPKGSSIHHADGNLELPYEPVYIPTLSELIEACGEDFFSLHYLRGTWWAATLKDEKAAKEYSTPEEAVARLYIALKRK